MVFEVGYDEPGQGSIWQLPGRSPISHFSPSSAFMVRLWSSKGDLGTAVGQLRR